MKNLFLLLSIIFMLAACQKEASLIVPENNQNNNNNNNNNNNEDNDEEDEDDDDDTDNPYYFTAEIAGKEVKYEHKNGVSTLHAWGVYHNENSQGWDHFDIYEGTLLEKTSASDSNSIYVSILKYFNHEPSLDERWAIIKMGSHGYGLTKESPETKNGASIDYADEHGKWWSSEFGDQTGSTFTVTELVENDEHLYGMIFTAKFSCKLYDEEGNSIEVKNGIIRGPVYGQ